jgi:hypothetical protein
VAIFGQKKFLIFFGDFFNKKTGNFVTEYSFFPPYFSPKNNFT